jgi:hypothetical protein
MGMKCGELDKLPSQQKNRFRGRIKTNQSISVLDTGGGCLA